MMIRAIILSAILLYQSAGGSTIFTPKPQPVEETVAAEEAFSSVSCVSAESIMNYGGDKMVYGWRIADLKIYDTPRPLIGFYLDRAPQSWCYVPYYKKY